MSRKITRGFMPDRLVALRDRLGLSSTDLARVAGIGSATIGRWEGGRTSPNVPTLKRVVEALDKIAKENKVGGVSIADVVDVPRDERFPGDWRILRGMTQPDLASQAKIGTPTLSRIERGEVELADKTAEKLAAALGVTVDELRAAHSRARARPPGAPA